MRITTDLVVIRATTIAVTPQLQEKLKRSAKDKVAKWLKMVCSNIVSDNSFERHSRRSKENTNNNNSKKTTSPDEQVEVAMVAT